MHFANKAGFGVFTASDEMLLKIFVHHFEWMLSACNVYTRTMSQAKWLQGVLRASTDLESTVVPPYVPPSNDPHHHRRTATTTSQPTDGVGAGVDMMTLARGRLTLRRPVLVMTYCPLTDSPYPSLPTHQVDRRVSPQRSCKRGRRSPGTRSRPSKCGRSS